MYERNCEQGNGSRNKHEEKQKQLGKSGNILNMVKITEKKGSGNSMRNKRMNSI